LCDIAFPPRKLFLFFDDSFKSVEYEIEVFLLSFLMMIFPGRFRGRESPFISNQDTDSNVQLRIRLATQEARQVSGARAEIDALRI
jgi:hypothetical protein